MEKELLKEAIKPSVTKIIILLISFLLWTLILSFITLDVYKSQNEITRIAAAQTFGGIDVNYYQMIKEIDKQYPTTLSGGFKKNLFIPPSIFMLVALYAAIFLFSYLKKNAKARQLAMQQPYPKKLLR